jgi:hypothetical protein
MKHNEAWPSLDTLPFRWQIYVERKESVEEKRIKESLEAKE